MIRVALRGMGSRRLRTALTALAIVLGVAMISGAYTLTDTMRSAADTLSSTSYQGTDAAVSAHTAFDSGNDFEQGTPPTVPASVLAKVRATPGVGVAIGDIIDLNTKIVGRNGKPIGTGPYFGEGVDAKTPGAARLSAFKLSAGRFPTRPGEVVIDVGTADKEKLSVGKRVTILTRGPARRFLIVGLATFGGVKSIGTATTAVFDLSAAQDLFRKRGAYDSVLVAAAPGTSPDKLRSNLRAKLGKSVKVDTAAGQDRYTLGGLKDFVGFIETFLLVFGFIAVFVGAFTIFNTLSVTVAQRSREFALLRTIGASRRQVLGSVVVEALAIGFVASVVGLFTGLGLAKLLSSVLSSLGLDLPSTSTVFRSRTVIVSLIVGTVVTVAAGMAPALRATRVSPVTVLREGAEIPASRIGRFAPAIAVLTTLLGVGLLAYGVFASGVDTTARLAILGVGCLVLFIGVALISPRIVAPLAGFLGRPAQRVGRSAGVLARRNAMRNPGRTAATASALMIGVALVTFVAVLGQGLRTSVTGSLNKELKADYVAGGSDGFSPIDTDVARTAAGTPGVTAVSTLIQDRALVFGKKTTIDGVQPATFARMYHFDWKQGSDAVFAALGPTDAIVRKQYSTDHKLHIGSQLTLTAPSGKRLTVTVRAVDDPPPFNPLGLGDVTISRTAFGSTFDATHDRYAFIQASGGARPATTRALKRALKPFADAKVQTGADFKHDQAAGVNQIVVFFYVLLALAVIVSLFGIVNTLALSVFERTRELGMLRAVGMSRRQVRRMIRHESIITALIGVVLGIVVGMFLAALVTTALSGEGLRFAVPIVSLILFLVLAVVAGVLAAILPAWRAGRLNVLEALQYE
jgi:putative ABC transport system permease protein